MLYHIIVTNKQVDSVSNLVALFSQDNTAFMIQKAYTPPHSKAYSKSSVDLFTAYVIFKT